jgi:hypothetical protein
MKPYGKKNPESQKAFGCPFMTQSCMKATRSNKSLYHEVSGFKDG